MIVIGIDQSKRSTAVVALEDDKLVDFMLVTPPSNYDTERLINYQWSLIEQFIDNMYKLDCDVAIALEGAAFAAGGASSDLLWGIQWYIRTRIFVQYPMSPIGIITPATWRSKVLPIVEQREFKSKFGGKIGLKHGVVSKLPEFIREKFDKYLERNKFTILESKGREADGRSEKYKEGLFDLADAWGIATHRTLLSKGTKKAVIIKTEKKISTLQRRFPNAK